MNTLQKLALCLIIVIVQQRECLNMPPSLFNLNLPNILKALTGNWHAAPVLPGDDDSDGPPSPHLYKGIGGYQCKSAYCAEEGRPGSKWDFVCNLEDGVKYFCVPFVVDKSLSDGDLKEVYRAMRWMRENTCVAYVFRKSEADFVELSKGDGGCASESLGKSGGKQFIKLGPGCYEYPAVAFHELMHAVGFEHIHQRADRDQHININMSNVDPALASQFKLKSSVAGTDNMTFNYDSVLLYGSLDFQKDGLKNCDNPSCYTITRKNGERLLSVYMKPKPAATDYKVINELYGCDHPDFQKKPKVQRQASPNGDADFKLSGAQASGGPVVASGFNPGSNGFGPGSNGFGPGSSGFGPGSNGFGPGSSGFGPGFAPAPDSSPNGFYGR